MGYLVIFDVIFIECLYLYYLMRIIKINDWRLELKIFKSFIKSIDMFVLK